MTRERKQEEGRQGFGDDQGTRVGAPTPAGEGSGGGSGKQTAGRESRQTGAGAEAAEGVHTSEEREPEERTALDDVDTGRARFDEATVQRAGSEPIERQREHTSGYGGDGGSPKESSHEREPREPEGKAR